MAAALALSSAVLATVSASASASGAGAPAGRARHLLAAPGFDRVAHGLALHRLASRRPSPMPGARVVVVPHWWDAGDLIVGALRDLAATRPATPGGTSAGTGAHAAAGAVVGARSWRRVVLVGPDHAKVGPRVAFTSGRSWATPFGEMAADADAVAGLLDRTGLVADAPGLLEIEHGVAGLVPALKCVLPAAVLVPLAVRGDVRPTEVERIAFEVRALLGADTVVVVSADFAHGVPPHRVGANDDESLAALRSLDVGRVLSVGDEHVDARGALAIGMTLARMEGAHRFVETGRTDSRRMAGYAGGPVTSAIAGYYAP